MTNEERQAILDSANKWLEHRHAGTFDELGHVPSDPETKTIELRIKKFLGSTRVKVVKYGWNGEILIEFSTPKELKAILNKILKS